MQKNVFHPSGRTMAAPSAAAEITLNKVQYQKEKARSTFASGLVSFDL
jgi:hypothetical protein